MGSPSATFQGDCFGCQGEDLGQGTGPTVLKSPKPIRSPSNARTMSILAPTTENFHFAVVSNNLSLLKPFRHLDQPAIDNPTSFFQSTISRLRARQDEVEHVRLDNFFRHHPRLPTRLQLSKFPSTAKRSVGPAHETTRNFVLSPLLTSKSTAPTRLTAAKS